MTSPQGKKALKPGGISLNVHASSGGDEELKLMLILKELVEAEKIKPVIERGYSLEQVIEAHRYVEQGIKKGMWSLRCWLAKVEKLNIKKLAFEFVMVFAVTLVPAAIVTLLWNLIGNGESAVHSLRHFSQ